MSRRCCSASRTGRCRWSMPRCSPPAPWSPSSVRVSTASAFVNHSPPQVRDAPAALGEQQRPPALRHARTATQARARHRPAHPGRCPGNADTRRDLAAARPPAPPAVLAEMRGLSPATAIQRSARPAPTTLLPLASAEERLAASPPEAESLLAGADAAEGLRGRRRRSVAASEALLRHSPRALRRSATEAGAVARLFEPLSLVTASPAGCDVTGAEVPRGRCGTPLSVPTKGSTCQRARPWAESMA